MNTDAAPIPVWRTFEELPPWRAVVTIGGFDGVHRGHQALLAVLRQAAREYQARPVVVTFDPLPRAVLRGKHENFYLTLADEKVALLAQHGAHGVLLLPFDRDLAARPGRAFIEDLHARLRFPCLCVGYNFALGRNREGDVPALRAWGEALGYEVRVVGPVTVPGLGIVSSSRIREALAQGRVARAAQLLGRWYAVQGPVVRGDARGRRLGFPTANLALDPRKALPARGVYAAWAWVADQPQPAVVNIGYRPTFGAAARPQVEAHLLDFQGDLYGQRLRLEFVQRLREERSFPSVDALRAQIARDVQRAREVLSHVRASARVPSESQDLPA
ncbi:MAG: bifunctional riboflavin kinase/FAD synthetase [Chloroflexi bacterium]|nr:bifunctional riboflavin kinase/FAD synthetase [Chloroflexota bacterium]